MKKILRKKHSHIWRAPNNIVWNRNHSQQYRPLTFTYENPNDNVLTPNHLLFGRCLNLQAKESKEAGTIDVCSRYKHIQNLIENSMNFVSFTKQNQMQKINKLFRYLMLETLSWSMKKIHQKWSSS